MDEKREKGRKEGQRTAFPAERPRGTVVVDGREATGVEEGRVRSVEGISRGERSMRKRTNA